MLLIIYTNIRSILCIRILEPKVPVNTGEPTVPPVRPPPFCGESTVLYGKGGGVRGNRRFPVTGVVAPVFK